MQATWDARALRDSQDSNRRTRNEAPARRRNGGGNEGQEKDGIEGAKGHRGSSSMHGEGESGNKTTMKVAEGDRRVPRFSGAR